MLGFAAIGVGATLVDATGVPIATQRSPEAVVQWLAPTPPPSASPSTLHRAPPLSLKASAVAAASAVPARAEHACDTTGELCSNQPEKAAPEGVTSDGKVILNVASAEVLTRLPGVGAKRAEAIVQLRDRLGRFRRSTDLLRVRGIGVRSLKRMLPHLVVDAPQEKRAEKEPQLTRDI